MIKAAATLPDGTGILVVGLSFANLDRFREKPTDSFIKISGKEFGLKVDIIIFSGETEAHCMTVIEQFLSPETKMTTSEKLKQ